MGLLLCYLFMHFPGERTMRGAWQEDTMRACTRAEELEKQLAAAVTDPTGAGATSESIVNWTKEVDELEAASVRATREQGLARRCFVDAMRIVDSLAVRLQEARHGARADVMIALGDSEYAMFTEVRTNKIRELFKSDEESGAATNLLEAVLKSNFLLLKNVYKHYAPAGNMSNLNFWSLVRDCGLEDEKLSAAQIDIIFTRADLARDNVHSHNQPYVIHHFEPPPPPPSYYFIDSTLVSIGLSSPTSDCV